MALNFNNMVMAHFRWKEKLKSAIEKQEPIDIHTAGRDDQCELGKWIYGEGKQYARLAEYKDLVEKHAKFHALIPPVIEQARSSPLQALAMLDSVKGGVFGKASTNCINAIGEIKRAVGQ